MLVDVLGYIDDASLANGLLFHPITPRRIVDTRSGTGYPSALGTGTTAAVTVPGTIGSASTTALALNVTAVEPTSSTYLSVFTDGSTRPRISTLNPIAGRTVPNAVFVVFNGQRKFDVFNSRGTVTLLVDVAGYYDRAG